MKAAEVTSCFSLHLKNISGLFLQSRSSLLLLANISFMNPHKKTYFKIIST